MYILNTFKCKLDFLDYSYISVALVVRESLVLCLRTSGNFLFVQYTG